MPSAYAESKKDKEKVVREDIGGLMAELSRRPQTPERTRKLTGPERAAVLMLSLGEQYGAKIFGLLDDDELREISIVMSSLGTIEAESVEQLLLEFVSRMPPELAALAKNNAVLAVSLEPPGGSTTGLPTGPVIATGKLTSL